MAPRTFWYMGGPCDLSKLVSHYRAMARREPSKAMFWRTVLRGVIRTYREQAANPERRAA